MEKYTEDDVIKQLTSDGSSIEDYLVVLGDGEIGDIIFSVHSNVLFYYMLENDLLYFECVKYIKKIGKFYKNRQELKIQRPDIFFGK